MVKDFPRFIHQIMLAAILAQESHKYIVVPLGFHSLRIRWFLRNVQLTLASAETQAITILRYWWQSLVVCGQYLSTFKFNFITVPSCRHLLQNHSAINQVPALHSIYSYGVLHTQRRFTRLSSSLLQAPGQKIRLLQQNLHDSATNIWCLLRT